MCALLLFTSQLISNATLKQLSCEIHQYTVHGHKFQTGLKKSYSASQGEGAWNKQEAGRILVLCLDYSIGVLNQILQFS